MKTALAKTKIDSDKIRKEIQELTGRLREIKGEAEHKIVRLANQVFLVQKHELYLHWKDPATGKLYTGFDSWLRAEVSESRSSVYRFLGIKEHLSDVPDETLEKIGSSRCFELVRVAREKPSMLPRFLKDLEKDPEIPLFTIQQRVVNTLAGSHPDSGRYDRIEFAVKVEDAPYVFKALAVMQALEAVDNPETAAGRGQHLISLAQEYLSGREQTKILKKLEEAGAFSKSAFAIEE
jgi:hypothetical protein